jgi:hypothetical protein
LQPAAREVDEVQAIHDITATNGRLSAAFAPPYDGLGPRRRGAVGEMGLSKAAGPRLNQTGFRP